MSQSSSKKLSRHEKRELDVEIRFMEGVVRRDPYYIDALLILGEDYTARGWYRKGLKIDQRLVQILPDDPGVHYNLACSYALVEECDKAADCLERALDLGYADFRWLARDPDLENLRKHPRYQQIKQKVRTLRVKLR